jgi:hypothetical protein
MILTRLVEAVGIFFVPAACIVLLVGLYLKGIRRRNELKAELYAKAIEKGMELPADLFAAKPTLPTKTLRSGIICIAVGLGIALFFVLDSAPASMECHAEALYAAGRGAIGLGAIPFMVGLAYLAIYFIEKKRTGEQG